MKFKKFLVLLLLILAAGIGYHTIPGKTPSRDRRTIVDEVTDQSGASNPTDRRGEPQSCKLVDDTQREDCPDHLHQSSARPPAQPTKNLVTGAMRSADYFLDTVEVERCVAELKKGKKPIVEITVPDHGVKRLRLENDDRMGDGIKGYSVSGSFEGHPGSIGVLSHIGNGDAYAGTIMIPNVGFFRIKTVQRNQSSQRVIEKITEIGGCATCGMNAGLLGGSVKFETPDGLTLDNAIAIAAAPPEVYIRVSVGYSNAAVTEMNDGVEIDYWDATGVAIAWYAMDACIQAAATFTNHVHQQSGSCARFVIQSYTGGLPEVPTDTLENIRNKITTEKYTYDNAYATLTAVAASSEVKADVEMFVHSSMTASGDSNGGIASVPIKFAETTKTTHGRGMSYCVITNSYFELGFAHETGHLFGCAHDVDNAFTGGVLEAPWETVTEAPVGSRFLATHWLNPLDTQKEYGTLMSYPVALDPLLGSPIAHYLPYFSNAFITMSDGPLTGISRIGGGSVDTLGLPGPYASGGADNVKCLNTYAETLASYDSKTSAPVMVSMPTVSCRVGEPLTFGVLCSNFGDITGYSCLPVFPSGLEIEMDSEHVNNETAGKITGTPTTPGVFNLTLTLANRVASSQATVTIFVLPALTISPTDALIVSGPTGGPFSPNTKTYILNNESEHSLNWTASANVSWLNLSASSGSLAAASCDQLTVSINSNANSLPVGTHTATVTITGPGDPLTIPVTLTVEQPASGTSGFTWVASINSIGGGVYEGTAVLTGYSGSADPVAVPRWVTGSITVTNPTTGLPEPKLVNCRVTGFSNFLLNSNAQFVGDVNIIGDFSLSGHILIIGTSASPSNVIHQSGMLTLGGGRLEIGGNYLQASDSDGNGNCWGTIRMNNAADYLLVGGNARFCDKSYYYLYPRDRPTLTAGTVEVRGNFTQAMEGLWNFGQYSYTTGGTHRTLLSGTGTQTVSFENPGDNNFNILEVTNPSGVVINTNVRFTSLLASGVAIHFADTGGAVAGALGADAKFTGNAGINGNLDMKGHLLSVIGTLVHQSGDLTLGGGRLEITGDYLQQRDADNSGSYESYCYGRVIMNNVADHIKVNGNAQFWADNYYGSSNYSAGTLEVAGDFTQKNTGSSSTSSFSPSATHTTLLSGSSNQTVRFESHANSYFGILKVTNPSGVVINTNVRFISLLASGVAIHFADTGGVAAGALGADAKFTGNVRINGNLDMKGRLLSVIGTLIHQSGDLTLGGGRLEITGDYLQQSDADNNGSYESYCYGRVIMNNVADHIKVNGNVQFWAHNYYGSSNYSAGTLEVAGDFSQKNTGISSTSSFSPSVTHTTLLSGSSNQTVMFESPASSYFGILKVTNPSGVTFATSTQVSKFIGNGSTIQSSAPANTLMLRSAATELAMIGTNSVQSVISGYGMGLTKTGTGTLDLNAANTYTGTTTVSAGVLGGSGSVSGPVTIASGGTLSPGLAAIGSFGINHTLTLNFGSTIAMQIAKSGATLSNDSITGLTGITYGGTLQVTLTGDTPTGGDKFILFTKTSGAYSGSFATLSLPALPPGSKWETSGLLEDGSISVISSTLANPPVFDPPSGYYASVISVSITSDAGSTIHYTTDGSDPLTSPTKQCAPSPITGIAVAAGLPQIIKAYTAYPGLSDSPVAVAVYNTATWANANGGSWPVAGNWVGANIGNGTGVIADFTTLDLTTSRTVTLDEARTIGGLRFGDSSPSHNWTLSTGSAGPLTLQTTNGSPFIEVSNHTTTISTVLAGTHGLEKSGAGTLILTPANTYTGATSVTEGTLEVRAKSGEVDYSVSQGSILRLGYNSASGYNSKSITVHGSGVAAFSGLQFKRGITFHTNGGILLTSQPTTIRAYGTGTNPYIRGHDVNAAYFLKNDAAASGSVVAPEVNVSTGTYGYKIITDTGANTTSGDLTISGIISGTGGSSAGDLTYESGLRKLGSGSLKLTNANTHSKATSVMAGSLILASGDNRLPSGGSVVLGTGSTSGHLVLGDASGASSQTLADLRVTGTGTANSVMGGNVAISTLTLNVASAGAFSGRIGGTGAHHNKLSLVKTGTGTLSLTGTNTYTGDTTVLAGTLALGGNAVANTNKLVLNGGKIEIGVGVTETVGTLYFDTTQQAPGTWGSSQSTASHKDDSRFTGAGLLVVTSGPLDYAGWATTNVMGQAFDQDYDHDGVPNGVEYFMGAGGDGLTTNPPLINGTVTWPKSPDFVGTYQVQSSTNLNTWIDVTNDTSQVTSNGTCVIWTRPPTPGNRFVRLQVVPN